jgi:uracil-DNA glycosylase family 4
MTATADEAHAELAALARAVRAHVEVEDELGGSGVAAWQGPPPSVTETRSADDTVDARAAGGAQDPAAAALAPGPREERPTDSEDRRRRLDELAAEAAACTACVLHQKRKRSVFARGTPEAELAFVGEGPGHDEDLQGLPFVGAAGQLLDRMIAAMGLGRDAVYVCNVVKCRPPENRTPAPEEAIACARFLVPQLELVAPKIIVALGRCAAENLGVARAGSAWRGRWGSWHGIAVMPTYHPAYLLRSPEHKRVVWEDLQQVMTRLGLDPKARQRTARDE